MTLNLTKPLIVFDLETTGLDVAKDRIIQISYIKIFPDATEQRANHFVNPERKLPAAITELTHITDEMLAGAPTFKELAPRLKEVFLGCDFCGYNSNQFDIPMLAEEFLRAGVEFDFRKCRLIDAMTIFRRMERRNLAAAYKFYCGRKMDDDFQAHRADNDTEATWRVLQGQLARYTAENQEDPEQVITNDMDWLHNFCRQSDVVDFAGRMVWQEVKDGTGRPVLDAEGKPVKCEAFNFGKYKGQFVADVLRCDPGYYSWILNSDFTADTKQALTRIRLKMLTRK